MEVVFYPFDEAVEGHLGGVGNEGEYGVVYVVPDGLQNRIRQLTAQSQAFLVNFCVVAAGEVNALKRAIAPRSGGQNGGDFHFCVGFYPKGVAGGELVNGVKRSVKGGLDDWPLGGNHRHFVVDVVISGADSVRITQHKGVSLANHARHGVATVPTLGGSAQNFRNVQVIFLVLSTLGFAQSHLLGFIVQLGVFLVQKVPNLLQNGDGIGLFLGALAQTHQLVEQLVHVGHVEIAGQNEVAALVIALSEEGMAGLDGVFAVGTVPQVSQVDFAQGGHVVFEEFGVLQQRRVPAQCIVDSLLDAAKNIRNGLAVNASVAAEVALSGRHVELNGSQPGAVLAPVVLLLHQEVHFVEAVKGRPVLFQVVFQRLAKANKGYAAFVLDGVAHREILLSSKDTYLRVACSLIFTPIFCPSDSRLGPSDLATADLFPWTTTAPVVPG